MITAEDIANATFRKAKINGYHPADVEEFLDKVQQSFVQMQKEKMELVRKLEILAKKVEEYREEEESIRNTLFSAQKLADASVREAKHKSEVILRDASDKAERIVTNAQMQILEQQETLQNLKNEVSGFRARLLAIYREHLTLIDALPTGEKEEPAKAGPVPPEVEAPGKTEPAAVPAASAPAAVEESVSHPAQPAVPAAPMAQAVPAAPVAAPEVPHPAAHEPVAVPFAPDPGVPAVSASLPAADYSQPGMTAIDEAEARAKFGALKFGDDYDLSRDDEESPLGLFKRKK